MFTHQPSLNSLAASEARLGSTTGLDSTTLLKPPTPRAAAEPMQASKTAHSIPIKIEPLKVACSSCNLRELCLPVGLSPLDLEQLDKLVGTRRQVSRGHTLFRSGDIFQSLFAVRTGFFKTCVSSEDGRDQVTGFQMAGELLGLDGISTDRHS